MSNAPETPVKPKSDLAPRVLTAVIGVPLILALAFFGPNWALWLFLASAAAIGCHEWVTMTLGRAGATGWVAVAWTFSLLSAAYWGDATWVYGAAAGGLVLSLLTAVWTGEVADSARRITGALSGAMYCGVLFGCLLSLVAATGDARFETMPGQAGWLLFPMLVIWAGDTGAYFAGRAFGRHKLAPKLSPKKTWEGAAGGALASVAGGFLAKALFLPELGPLEVVAFALPAAILGQIGDLTESSLKRSVGVKDSGWIIYGHGGMLDRVDALVLAAPWFALMKVVFGH